VVLIAASAFWISARGCFCYEPVRAACAGPPLVRHSGRTICMTACGGVCPARASQGEGGRFQF